MGLESVNGIWDLNAANPAPGDNKSEGDDHLRNIKKAVKATFPNVNAPVTKTDEALNQDNRVRNATYEGLVGDQPMLEWHRPGQVAYAQYIAGDNRWIFARTGGSGNWVATMMSVGPAGDFSFNGPLYTQSTVTAGHVRIATGGASNIAMALPGRSDRLVHRNGDAMGFLGLDGNWNFFSHDNGDSWSRGNLSAFSDERVKRDWKTLPDDILERFAEIQLCGTYENTETGRRMAGISAQKFRAVFPEVVTGDEKTYLGVVYANAALTLVHKLTQRVLELEERLKEAGI